MFVQDKWISAATGKPASIRERDYDVAPPAFTFTGSPAEVQFEYLLCLTFILQDILDTIMYFATGNLNLPLETHPLTV